MLVSPAYWFITDDWTGTSALTMTTLLAGMVTLYLGFHAAKMDPRPEDRKDGEIADGAGELGFFPPYSWWPLWCAPDAGGHRLRHRVRGLVAVDHRRRARRAGARRAGSSSTTAASTPTDAVQPIGLRDERDARRGF